MDFGLPRYNTTNPRSLNQNPMQAVNYIDQEYPGKGPTEFLQRNVNSDWIAKRKLKHTRIIQKNAVYVIGIPRSIVEPRILCSADYFGKYGRIHSVDVNHKPYFDNENQIYLHSAYIRYSHNFEALLAIAT